MSSIVQHQHACFCSIVDQRDCSLIVTAFNYTTGGLDAMEMAKMVQKLHDCTNAKQFSMSGSNEILNPINWPGSLNQNITIANQKPPM
jgi:hypothetical protein